MGKGYGGRIRHYASLRIVFSSLRIVPETARMYTFVVPSLPFLPELSVFEDSIQFDSNHTTDSEMHTFVPRSPLFQPLNMLSRDIVDYYGDHR